MVGEAIKIYNNNTQIREKRRYKVDNGLEETEIEEEQSLNKITLVKIKK